MIAAAAVDVPTIGAISAMVVGVLTAIIAPLTNRGKNRAQTDSISTRTMLEVNENLREELREVRVINDGLRGQLRERDERIEALESRVQQLRQDVDVLEAEIAGLRGGSPASP